MKYWIVSRMIPLFAFEKKIIAFLYGLEIQGTKLFSINIGYQSYCSISCDWHARICIWLSSCPFVQNNGQIVDY